MKVAAFFFPRAKRDSGVTATGAGEEEEGMGADPGFPGTGFAADDPGGGAPEYVREERFTIGFVATGAAGFLGSTGALSPVAFSHFAFLSGEAYAEIVGVAIDQELGEIALRFPWSEGTDRVENADRHCDPDGGACGVIYELEFKGRAPFLHKESVHA